MVAVHQDRQLLRIPGLNPYAILSRDATIVGSPLIGEDVPRPVLNESTGIVDKSCHAF